MCHRQGYLPFFFTSHWQVLLSIQLNDVKFWDLVHWQWCICCLLLCLSYYITFHVHATRKESSSESSPRKTIKVPSSKVNLLLLLMNNDVSFVSAPWRIPQRVRYIARVLLFVCRRSRRRPPENQIHYTHNSWLWLWSGERELRNIMLCIYLHYCPGTLRCTVCGSQWASTRKCEVVFRWAAITAWLVGTNERLGDRLCALIEYLWPLKSNRISAIHK